MKRYLVDTNLLEDNISALRKWASSPAIIGIIKGNGYGLGLIPVADLLWKKGIRIFGVTEPEEVHALRTAFPSDAVILMLRETCIPAELEMLFEDCSVLTIGSKDAADSAKAISAGRPVPCHIKIDTGMGRYGFLPSDWESVLSLYNDPSLDVQGIYTHFHSSFCSEAATRRQFSDFSDLLEKLTAAGIEPGLRHCCNSHAFLLYPEMHLDAVRIGSALLGRVSCTPPIALHRIGRCEGTIETIRTIPTGHSIGYGAGWTAKQPTTIAVCGIGYYHGFSVEHGNDLFDFRACARTGFHAVKDFLHHNCLTVTIGGRKVPVRGHVGMVQTILDITGLDVSVGDIVEFNINPLMLKGMEPIWTESP